MSPGGPLAGPLFLCASGRQLAIAAAPDRLVIVAGADESRIDDQAGHRLVEEAAHDGFGKHLISEVLVLTQP